MAKKTSRKSKKSKADTSESVHSTSDIRKEIDIWRARIAGKGDEASELLVQVQNIEFASNVFLGEYDSKVGLLYVELDKIKLKVKEYQLRIDLAEDDVISQGDLDNIEEKVSETFAEERQKINDLEDEATKASEEYREYLEQEEKGPVLNVEAQEELKKLYRILAFRFHPDRAMDENQKKEYHRVMSEINEAYKAKDQSALSEYMRLAEREDKIAKETPEETLARLKTDYEIVLGIITELEARLEDLKEGETYKLKMKVDEAKKEDRDLLQELAEDVKAEIDKNQALLDELVSEYKEIIREVGY